MLPSGFSAYKQSSNVIIVRPHDEKAIDESWFDADTWRAQQAIVGTASGRGITYFIKQTHRHMILRQYLRGGLIAKLVKESFVFNGLGNTRVVREINILVHLHTQGVNVPKVIAGLIKKHGALVRSKILLERIANAQDCHSILSASQGHIDTTQWRSIGAEIKKMHNAGVDHTDLNIHNILLDDADRVWIIDFDKCGYTNKSDIFEANLARLARSLQKESGVYSSGFDFESAWRALISGYEEERAN